VFFRNVGIYMTESAWGRFYTGLVRVVRPGGLLLLGPADPVPTLDGLVRIPGECNVFSRVNTAASSSTKPKQRPSAPRMAHRSSPKPSVRDHIDVEHSGYAAREPVRPPDHDHGAQLQESARLADCGKTERALAILDREIAKTGPRPCLLALRGRIHFACGRAEEAARDFRAVLFLDGQRLVARFHYALALDALGRRASSLAQLREVLRGVSTREGSEILDDGETSRVSLERAASELLESFR